MTMATMVMMMIILLSQHLYSSSRDPDFLDRDCEDEFDHGNNGVDDDVDDGDGDDDDDAPQQAALARAPCHHLPSSNPNKSFGNFLERWNGLNGFLM